MPPTTIQQPRPRRVSLGLILQQAKQKIDALDAELLIAHVLNKPREWILAHQEVKVHKIIKSINQRAKGVPLAYLTGHKEFFGLDFVVNKDVLIPRPDTETVVTLALEHFSTLAHKQVTLIDVGTGSGCIPIAIASHIRQSGLSVYPYSIIAIDISKKALTIAKRNEKKHKVKIKFLHGDLLAPVIARSEATKQSSRQSSIFNLESSIIITANLPYLTPKQYRNSPSIQHEPKLALVANKNGLALYEKLLKQVRRLLKIGNWKLEIFLEIDPSQSRPITRLIKSLLPTAKVKITKDLSGLDRIVKIWYN